LSDPDVWWCRVEGLIASTYERVGIDNGRARDLVRLVRPRYTDTTVGWRLHDDALAVLARLRVLGWRHAILSNRVPELPSMVSGPGLSHLIDVVRLYRRPDERSRRLLPAVVG